MAPYWDNSPDQLDLTVLFKEASQSFPKEDLRKIGHIFAKANKRVISARLLFRASEHNYLSAAFKDACAGHAPTLMIAKS